MNILKGKKNHQVQHIDFIKENKKWKKMLAGGMSFPIRNVYSIIF